MNDLTQVEIKYSDGLMKEIEIRFSELESFASTDNKPNVNLLPYAFNHWEEIDKHNRILIHLRLLHGFTAKYRINELNITSHGF